MFVPSAAVVRNLLAYARSSRSRTTRHLSAVLALAAVIAAAGCTDHTSGRAEDSTSLTSRVTTVSSVPASPTAAPVSAVVHAPAKATSVIGASTPQQAAAAISAALFESAPVVIVASSNQASVSGAAAIAERLGVPLLLADRPSHPSPSTVSPSAQLSALDRELRTLGCTHVLAVGDVPALPGVHVVGDASALPVTAAPKPLDNTTVIVHATDDVATVAVSATARAAGATVVGVKGDDPRGDAHAIAALVHAPMQHVVAVGSSFGAPAELASRVAVAHSGTQLPGGGQLIFPGHRFVALYGHPGGAALGVLGAQGLDPSIERARDMAASYQSLSSVTVVPTFEIIATVAQASAGNDGNFSAESSVDSLRPWVDKARTAGLYVVLDLQPGRADVLEQAKLYAPLLQLPNVGLAVDPEWALAPTQLPLHQIGSIDASRINAVGAWLDAFTASKHLPQKLFVLHQFRLSMIGNEPKLQTHYDNLAVLIHMDGQGTQPNKNATWRSVVNAAPKGVPFGWKNFYREDHPMFTPEQTMARSPQPMMISYQ